MLLAERLSHSHPSPWEDHRQGLGAFHEKTPILAADSTRLSDYHPSQGTRDHDSHL
jgi:hypothetical protein